MLSEVEDYATWAWTAAKRAHEAADLVSELLAIEVLHAASLLRGTEAPPRLGEGTAPLLDRLRPAIDAAPLLAEDLVAAAQDALLGD